MRRDLEDLAVAAGGEEDRPRPKGVELAWWPVWSAMTPATGPAGPSGSSEVEDLVLVEEGHLATDALLEERLEDGVPGAVRGEAADRRTGPSP